MAGERYRHIFLKGPTQSEKFRNPRGGRDEPRLPQHEPASHAAHLRERFEAAWAVAEARRAVGVSDRKSVCLEFVGEPDFDLLYESLEYIKSGIRLRNVRRVGDPATIMATLSVPNDKRGQFLRKLSAYEHERTKSGRPRNQPLIDGISDIRLSVLESFWCDDAPLPSGDELSATEVWIAGDDTSIIEKAETVLQRIGIEQLPGRVVFPERSVILVSASRRQLEQLIESSDDIAELRLSKKTAAFYVEMDNREQVEHARGLLARIVLDRDSKVAVCILDTGVNRGHILLSPVLAESDLHTVDPAWGVSDHDRHGTYMAGVATYGDLIAALASRGPIRLTHVLESVKILPPPPSRNPRELWGYVTAQGIYRAEIERPERLRIACLAVTSEDGRDRGRPSSWSGMVDQLTSGSVDGRQRLVIVSAGNVVGQESWLNYPDANKTSEVHDPAQAWNALTVGAHTDKVVITDESLASYYALAPRGGLSPYSTTSLDWERKWPIKPEVVCEGGNIAVGPNRSVQEADELQVLSTYHMPQVSVFGRVSATSAAAAKVSWIAAKIQALYPDSWPETVRGLVVHSAKWTDKLKEQFLTPETRAGYANLIRVCGFGVPDLERALYCAANSLTLISQAYLQPFERNGSSYRANEMHLYRLPWPMDVLRDLGETSVDMRVTLSYFVEPSPGQVGWRGRYRYPSHGLRFEMNGPGESESDFIRRVNMLARDDNEKPGTEGPGSHWIIGPAARNVGSIHSDIWRGTAADLSQSHLVTVYPVGGWWKERAYLERWDRKCRYSLIVSIEPPESVGEIDIYTPVALQVGIAIPIEVGGI